MKATDFDQLFDDGEENIISFLDLSQARRPNLEQKRVNINLPLWVLQSLDNEAIRLGVSRELLIERWLTEKSSWAELVTDK